MYYVLYDKDFKAIGAKKSYKISKWSYAEKAYEFSELKIEGEAIESTIQATYVGLHEDKGRLVIMMYSGIPTTEKGITKISATDVRQILNTDAIIDLTETEVVEGETEYKIREVNTLYEYLLGILNTDYNGGAGDNLLGIEIVIDVTELNTDPLTFNEDAMSRTREVGNIWDTLQAVNAVYDCYVEAIIDYVTEKITFKVKRISNEISLKLNDFDAPKVKNDFTGTNRVVCVSDACVDGTTPTDKETYYLLSDDNVIDQTTAISTYPELIIYPPRIQVFQDADLLVAISKGIQQLYKNRFQANITIGLECKMGYMLENVGLNYQAKLYGFNSSDYTKYKILPVMEIYKDQSGKRHIKFGRLEEYWWL